MTKVTSHVIFKVHYNSPSTNHRHKPRVVQIWPRRQRTLDRQQGRGKPDGRRQQTAGDEGREEQGSGRCWAQALGAPSACGTPRSPKQGTTDTAGRMGLACRSRVLRNAATLSRPVPGNGAAPGHRPSCSRSFAALLGQGGCASPYGALPFPQGAGRCPEPHSPASLPGVRLARTVPAQTPSAPELLSSQPAGTGLWTHVGEGQRIPFSGVSQRHVRVQISPGAISLLSQESNPRPRTPVPLALTPPRMAAARPGLVGQPPSPEPSTRLGCRSLRRLAGCPLAYGRTLPAPVGWHHPSRPPGARLPATPSTQTPPGPGLKKHPCKDATERQEQSPGRGPSNLRAPWEVQGAQLRG
nr:PREDICTED: nascent polypeptide-associated complex subunit alpha, muscle-specific form-like [Apteryx mantelli mantelli]XP_013806110.1 PREDICTED: nascent polypeptide-associated complex subunit alpha, muscle-specific form-like [Apteryx mantelli mantelli]